MHNQYFPKCTVDEPIEPPVPFGHLGLLGAVPNKCFHCQYIFEGSCTRDEEDNKPYLHLDHGPCGIEGPTEPKLYYIESRKKEVEIPAKCTSCIYLQNNERRFLHCAQDSHIWGDFPRGFDWGAWQPENSK